VKPRKKSDAALNILLPDNSHRLRTRCVPGASPAGSPLRLPGRQGPTLICAQRLPHAIGGCHDPITNQEFGVHKDQ
jgi:hypothetical protein